MNNIISQVALQMTSREIARFVEKRHDNVKRTIETLAESGVISKPQIEDLEEISNLGLPITRRQYVFSGPTGKRDSIVVVAQLSPEFTGRLVDRWQELEALQTPAVPSSFAQALQLAAEQQFLIEQQAATIAAEAPYAGIGRAITSASVMYVRDWVSLMKTDHNVVIPEKALRKYLHEEGYWYWTQTHPKETRAYSKFDSLFKLEVELINGYPRPVLKITGDGVLLLTSKVIEHFSNNPQK